MHIPDGFLSTPTWVTLAAVSAGSVGLAARQSKKTLGERQVPLLGLTSAFIFAAQMLNFPVAAGTSGHLLGGVLAAVLLGPWSGAVAMTTVLLVQALLFQDGGLTALGANVFNMVVLGTIGGYFVYLLLSRVLRPWTGKDTERPHLLAIALAAWFSVVSSAAGAAVELALSGVVPLRPVLVAMVGVHALIGLGEAVITTAVVMGIFRIRPDLLVQSTHAEKGGACHA